MSSQYVLWFCSSCHPLQRPISSRECWQVCPVDCHVSPWSEWSACPQQCVPGKWKVATCTRARRWPFIYLWQNIAELSRYGSQDSITELIYGQKWVLYPLLTSYINSHVIEVAWIEYALHAHFVNCRKLWHMYTHIWLNLGHLSQTAVIGLPIYEINKIQSAFFVVDNYGRTKNAVTILLKRCVKFLAVGSTRKRSLLPIT